MKSIDYFPPNPKDGDEMRFEYPQINSHSIWRFSAPIRTWEFVDMYRNETIGGREPAKADVGLAHASQGNDPSAPAINEPSEVTIRKDRSEWPDRSLNTD